MIIDRNLNGQKTVKSRNSSIELLRLIVMFLIIYYHLFEGLSANGIERFPRIIWIPIHIGVPVFVLISGYFGIRFTWKGFSKLIISMAIYTIGIHIVTGGVSFRDLFIVSRTPYWFMSYYLMLYVLSPFINRGLEIFSKREELCLILVLAIISLYIGGLHSNPVYNNGKNVLNFILIYSIGDSIKKGESLLKRIPFWLILLIAVLLPTFEIILYQVVDNNAIKALIWQEAFPYNSLGLIVNSILVFLLFTRFSFHSKFVNWMAKSCLAVYLIHGHPSIRHYFVNDAISILQNNSLFITALYYVVYAVAILIVCILIDKIVQIPVNALTELIHKNNGSK